MDLNRVIGNQGKIPWRLSADMKFFKQMTSDPKYGCYLLMGRKTFDSVGVLPNRHIFVLTTDPDKRRMIDTNGFKYINEDDFYRISPPKDKVWVCGGAEVYKRFLPECEEVYVTLVLGEYEGDAVLPYFEDAFPHQTLIHECKTHWIVKYSKSNT